MKCFLIFSAGNLDTIPGCLPHRRILHLPRHWWDDCFLDVLPIYCKFVLQVCHWLDDWWMLCLRFEKFVANLCFKFDIGKTNALLYSNSHLNSRDTVPLIKKKRDLSWCRYSGDFIGGRSHVSPSHLLPHHMHHRLAPQVLYRKRGYIRYWV